MTRRGLLAGLLLASVVGTGASASAADAEQAVLAAQDKRIAATLAADVTLLGEMMTDDLSYTHSNANVETKPEFLEGIRSGKYRYQAMAFDDRHVRLHGDQTAIVSGTCRVRVTSAGRDLDIRLRFTELYVKQAGAWKMVLWQSTRVPDPTP